MRMQGAHAQAGEQRRGGNRRHVRRARWRQAAGQEAGGDGWAAARKATAMDASGCSLPPLIPEPLFLLRSLVSTHSFFESVLPAVLAA